VQPWVSVNSVKDSIMVQMRSEIQTAQHGLSSLVHPAHRRAVLRADKSLLDDSCSTVWRLVPRHQEVTGHHSQGDQAPSCCQIGLAQDNCGVLKSMKVLRFLLMSLEHQKASQKTLARPGPDIYPSNMGKEKYARSMTLTVFLRKQVNNACSLPKWGRST